MPLPTHLQRFTDPIPVLSDGHVQLIDCMGDDLAVVDAARVSFFGKAEEHTDAANRHLIRYLLRHRHSTPFEMAEIKLRVRVPMDCWRQWIRHRTASVNESSTRYAPAIDSMDVTPPNEWRSQSSDNKQGSAGFVDPEVGKLLTARETYIQKELRDVYEERLEHGVAKEQARKDLPLSTYTEAYWKIDLHNLLHFLSLRLDPHAQLEIRLYAQAIAEIVKAWVPWTWEAFEDYRLGAMFFTRQEVTALEDLMDRLLANGYQADKLVTNAAAASGLKNGRELTELTAKLRRLFE